MASTRVVLPWSTWATMATLRRSSRVRVGIEALVSGRGVVVTSTARGRRAGAWGGRAATPVGVGPVQATVAVTASTMGRSAGSQATSSHRPGQPAQLVVVLERLPARPVGRPAPTTPASGTRSPSGQPGPSDRPGQLLAELDRDAEFLGELAVQGGDAGPPPARPCRRAAPSRRPGRRLGPARGSSRVGRSRSSTIAAPTTRRGASGGSGSMVSMGSAHSLPLRSAIPCSTSRDGRVRVCP